MQNPIEIFNTFYNGLCNHIKEVIYETDKWAGLVHLQGGICDEKQRGINMKKWGRSEEMLIVLQVFGNNPLSSQQIQPRTRLLFTKV